MKTCLVVQREAQREAAAAAAERAVGPLGDVLTLCLGDPYVLAPTAARTASFFAPPDEDGFDCVFVDGIATFDSLWLEAFAAALAQKLAPNGRLYLRTAGAAANPPRFPGAATVSRALGGEPGVAAGAHLGWRVGASPPTPPSALAWYLQDWHSILEADLSARERPGAELAAALPEAFRRLCERIDLDPGIPTSPFIRGRRTGQAADMTPDAALEWSLRYYGYAIGGIMNKGAACARIATALEIAPGSSWLDLGGGFGALSIDLALDPRVRAGSVVCVDQFPANLAMAARLFGHYAGLLAGRARFACCDIENYPPDRAPNVVTAFGSLLYLPRDRLGDTLARIWDSIAPGGALIVHENILGPTDPPGRDTAMMFREDELTGYLSALGEVQYFGATLHQPLAGPIRRNPYRIVRKPVNATSHKPSSETDDAEPSAPPAATPPPAAPLFGDAAAWLEVQTRYRSVPGAEGAELRRRHYRPFFQRLGRDVLIEEECWFGKPWRIVLDDCCGINRGAIFEGSSAIRIGRHVRIGHNFLVHSANHDTVLDERAHFERGYVLQPVEIGDNSLISANVAVMPGARIGSGSFVAAHCLVPGKAFAEGSYLAGAPARELPRRVAPTAERLAARLAPAPAIGLLVDGDEQAEAAALLTTALGLPQVAVIDAGQPLPSSLRAVVRLDAGNAAADRPEGVEIWRLEDGGDPAQAPWIEDLRGERVPLAGEVRRGRVLGGFGEEATLAAVCRASLFWATNASLKGSDEGREQSRAAWGLTLMIAACGSRAVPRTPCPGWDAVFEAIGQALIDPAVTAASWRNAAAEALRRLLDRDLERIGDPPLAAFFARPEAAAFAACRRMFLREPHLLAYFVWRWRDERRELCARVLREISRFLNTSTRKAGAAIAHDLLGGAEAADAILDELLNPGWIMPGACLIRVAPDRPSVDRYPPTVALLLERLLRQEPDAAPFAEDEAAPLHWRSVARAVGDPGADIDRASAPLVCAERRVLSRSLLSNWLAIQAAPDIGAGSLYLADHHYARDIEAVEAVWRRLFADILSRAGLPLIRPRLWPAGCDFALSLRYDVDRDAGSQQALLIAALEKKHANAACGSWYFLKDARHNHHVRHILGYWNQEYAVHTCLAADALEGQGATAHSSPQSRYWHGRDYLIGLEARGAAYAEAMVCNFDAPRPGWLPAKGADGGRRTRIWLTPLHYPLEGGGQTDASYFDQRLDAFCRQIAAGGHVIVGSHPDCDQGVMDMVLSREDLSRAWAASVGRVVDRVRALRGPEGLELLTDPEEPGSHYLRCARYLADVAVEVWGPGQNEPAIEVLQFNALMARRLTSVEVEPAARPAQAEAGSSSGLDAPQALIAARQATAAKDWAQAVAAWEQARAAGAADDQWRDGLGRAHLSLAREYDAREDWPAAFGQWRALAALGEEAFAGPVAAGTRRAGLRAARRLEAENREAEALAVWRAMLEADATFEPARKGVERLALRLARQAEANGDWAVAAERWRDLAELDPASQRAGEGLKRSLIRAARAAEEGQDWGRGLGFWREYSGLVPEDERGGKGVTRCAARAAAGRNAAPAEGAP